MTLGVPVFSETQSCPYFIVKISTTDFQKFFVDFSFILGYNNGNEVPRQKKGLLSISAQNFLPKKG